MTHVTVHGDGFAIDSPQMANAMDNKLIKARFFKELDKSSDVNRAPPTASAIMFPEMLGEIVQLCCQHSEAVPVAVATYALAFFSAYLGPMRHLEIADEQRRLNNYWLLIGPSGMGKGASEYGIKRIFKRIDERLQQIFAKDVSDGKTQGIVEYPSLDIHDGSLSSGEGLAAAKADSLKIEKNEPPVEITDKRFLLLESEFGNALNHAERSGNTLSHVLRNAYDGKSIKPLTKRDRTFCSEPYFVLVGNITPKELNSHKQSSVMSMNGMLNRTFIIWTKTTVRHSRPKPMDDKRVSAIAERLAHHLFKARNHSFETHWKKMRSMSKPLDMTNDAWQLWDEMYPALVNLPDCEAVQTLCRRHRLHIRITAGLLALMNGREVIDKATLYAALAWSDYSRQSVVYACRFFNQQLLSERQQRIGHGILQGLQHFKGKCEKSNLYAWFDNRIRRDELDAGLDWCLNFIPPLLTLEKIKAGRGRPVIHLELTHEGLRVLSL